MIATIDGLDILVDQYIALGDITPQMTGPLHAKLDMARTAPDEPSQDAYLQEFINLVDAQSGNKITPAVADILVNAARRLGRSLEPNHGMTLKDYVL